MSEFDEAAAAMQGEALEILGTQPFILRQPGPNLSGAVVGAFAGVWNDLGREEELELHGRRVKFSVIVECARAQFAQLPREGQLVTRSADGFTGRIVGEVPHDQLTVRFALDTRHQ